MATTKGNKSAKETENTKLEKISLKKLAAEYEYGDTFDFVSDGIGNYEDEEFGAAYVLGNDRQILFVSEGYEGRESVLHFQLREVIEKNPDIMDHQFLMTIELHKPSSSRYQPYWTLQQVRIKKDVKVASRKKQQTIVEYV